MTRDPGRARYGCFLPDLTGLASFPSAAGLPGEIYHDRCRAKTSGPAGAWRPAPALPASAAAAARPAASTVTAPGPRAGVAASRSAWPNTGRRSARRPPGPAPRPPHGPDPRTGPGREDPAPPGGRRRGPCLPGGRVPWPGAATTGRARPGRYRAWRPSSSAAPAPPGEGGVLRFPMSRSAIAASVSARRGDPVDRLADGRCPARVGSSFETVETGWHGNNVVTLWS